MRLPAPLLTAILLTGCPEVPKEQDSGSETSEVPTGTDCTDPVTWYLDDDDDGYGDATQSTVACDAPTGAVADATDCDDADGTVSPAGIEVCNDVDDDCDGTIDDDAMDAATWHADADADGFGDPATTTQSCDTPPGTVADATDCDDAEGAVNPAAIEICNDLDDNCDGVTDTDAVDPPTWYTDADADGFGDADVRTVGCVAPAGTVSDATDCDDADGAVNPAAIEVCNDLDDDCDGVTDTDAVEPPTWYTDLDGDGYGDAATGTVGCDQPEGTVAEGGDCDDSADGTRPGAAELCDGVDNDCDATTTEDGVATFWDSTGAWTDYTVTLTGTSRTASIVTLADEGTLRVCPGTWYTNIEAQADVTIEGLGDPEDVVLDGADDSSVISILTYGVDTILRSLTIQGGIGNPDADPDGDGEAAGGGIACTAGSTELTLDNVIVTDNTAVGGGGISAYNCDVQLIGGTVVTANVAEAGGGIYARSAIVAVEDSTFSDNEAEYGAGLYLYRTEPTIDGTTISGNVADTNGGGLLVAYSDLEVTNSVITDNTAGDDGGGLLFVYDSTLAVVGTTISDNAADWDGGGVYIAYRCSVSFEDSTVSDNAAGDQGGGVYIEEADVSCTGSTTTTAGMFSNESGDEGGGIAMLDTSTFTATECDLGSSGTDNEPEDLWLEIGASYKYGDDTTVTCDETRCGTLTTSMVGTTITEEITGSASIRGNVVTATEDATLEDFEMYLTPSSTSCALDWYVLSAASETATSWTVEWSDTTTAGSTTSQYYGSGTVGVAIETGRIYVLAVGWECAVAYRQEETASDVDAGFGTIGPYQWSDSAYDPSDYTGATVAGTPVLDSDGDAEDIVTCFQAYDWSH